MVLHKYSRFVGPFLVMLATVGCGGSAGGPPLGLVTGTVTMDGEPLPRAEVTFTPTSGRGSVAITNAEGKYDLIYVDSTHGAAVGEHTVRIKTYVEEDSPEAQKFKEKIPKKYHVESQLKETVKPGRNNFSFALESH